MKHMGTKFTRRTALTRRINASGLKRKDILKALGITRPTLLAWERGDKPIIRVDNLADMARILKCRVADLKPDMADVA